MYNKLFILIVFITSLIATLGSLYFSEVMYFIPCVLCWYQRILMYPIVLLSVSALFQKDKNFYKYALPLSIPGMFLSSYHIYLQFFSNSEESDLCTGVVKCSVKYIEWFGFITIPVLSFIAFTIINIVLSIMIYKNKNN